MDQYLKRAASRIRNIDLKSLKISDNIIFILEKQIMTCHSIRSFARNQMTIDRAKMNFLMNDNVL